VAQERLQIRLDAIDNTKKAFNSLSNNTNKVKNALTSLKGILVSIGTGVALKSIIDVTSRFEDLRDSLSAVTGSAKAGASAFSFIQDFALRSQFSVEDLTTSFITLRASGIEPTEKLFRVFTDTAAVTTDQLGTLQALTRVFSRGVQGGLGLEELNQIADRGVPVFRLLKEELGIGRLEIGKFGQTTEGARKILDALEKTLGTTFKGATAQKLDNLSTSSSNLGIAFRNFQDVIGQAGFGGAVTALFDSLSKLLVVLNPLGEVIGFIGGIIGKTLSLAVEVLVANFKFWISASKEVKDIILALIKIALQPFVGILGKIKDAFVILKNAITEIVNNTLLQLQKGLQLIVDKYKELKELLGIEPDTKALDITKGKVDELAKAVQEYKEAYEASFLGELTIKAQESLDKMKSTFGEINQIIIGSILGGIKSMSQALAESIILGKDLGKAFKEFVLKGIISALAGLIQYFLTKLLIFALEKLFPNLIKDQVDLEQSKLSILKQQTKELQKQAGLRIFLAFFGMAEGGRVNGSRAEGGRVNGYRANGGATQNGNAYIVGERGRELFIPSTDGQIVPNERLGGMGSTNISFTVQATDVKGVKELLIDNRATITNIINSALNQKGKPALI
jgi:ribosomal protein S13